MKQLKKIYLVFFLLVILWMSVMVTQAQKVNSNDLISSITKSSISAGADAYICSGSEFTTSGVNHTNIMTLWRTTGDGIFENPQSLQAIYTPGESDLANGNVSLYLVVFAMGGYGNEIIVDEMILHIDECSVINPIIKEF